MKFYDIIFCDDIRDEINNKKSLVGVYNDRIVFHTNQKVEIQWPVRTRLSVLLRFKLDSADQYPDKFEFEYFMNDKSIAKVEGALKIDSSRFQEQISLPLKAEGIPLELGKLGFSIKLYKGNKLLLSEEDKQAMVVLRE